MYRLKLGFLSYRNRFLNDYSDFKRIILQDKTAKNEYKAYRQFKRTSSYSLNATGSKMTSFFTIISKNNWDINLFN